MAKTDSSTPTETTPSATPRIGDQVSVIAPAGVVLINNEAGAPFAPGVPTPQTVTPTLLRRLADRDLTLVR